MGNIFIDKAMMCSMLNVPPDQPWKKKRQRRDMLGIAGSLQPFSKTKSALDFHKLKKKNPHDLAFIFKTKQKPKVLLIVVVFTVQEIP